MGHGGQDGRRFYGACATAVALWATNQGMARGGLAADRRVPHVSDFFHFQKFPKNGFLCLKNRYIVRENPGKFMFVGNQI
jgi:hypothetical protein